MDESGEVRCYVTPAPGVNLQNYIGRQVGVTGTRGYMPEQRASHIMARHIAVLDGNLLRSLTLVTFRGHVFLVRSVRSILEVRALSYARC